MIQHFPFLRLGLVGALSATFVISVVPAATQASSHMDAPLITFDDAANTTDVYAFRSAAGGNAYLSTALAVYPFEEPGIGPNKYNFDDNVRYAIHVALGSDLASGRATLTYQFDFTTTYKDQNTILQSFLGTINNVDDANQNLTQRYTVTKIDHRTNQSTVLGAGVVPPNNQGLVTPKYNRNNDGESPVKDGVATAAELDTYTQQAVLTTAGGYQVFAGQRDDGFYADIQAIFDVLNLRNPGKDAQGGFNVHTIALNIPLSELGGDQQVVGVYATTSRPRTTVLTTCLGDRNGDNQVTVDEIVNSVDNALSGCPNDAVQFVQVGRQGNPLFNEALVAIADKDTYNQTTPENDAALFAQYALEPELGRALNVPAISNRTDIAGIFIPDLIKVDLSTGPARLTGGGADDEGFSRLSIFGGDGLISTVQAGLPLPDAPAGLIPGGWPNGRRFGDDVVDIAVTALFSDLRGPLVIAAPVGDNVNTNDVVYNKVFPYAAPPQNGRTHSHP